MALDELTTMMLIVPWGGLWLGRFDGGVEIKRRGAMAMVRAEPMMCDGQGTSKVTRDGRTPRFG